MGVADSAVAVAAAAVAVVASTTTVPLPAPGARRAPAMPPIADISAARAELLERFAQWEPPEGADPEAVAAFRADVEGLINRYQPLPGQSANDALETLRAQFDDQVEDFVQDVKLDAVIDDHTPDADPDSPFQWVPGHVDASGTYVDGHWERARADADPDPAAGGDDAPTGTWVDGYYDASGNYVKGHYDAVDSCSHGHARHAGRSAAGRPPVHAAGRARPPWRRRLRRSGWRHRHSVARPTAAAAKSVTTAAVPTTMMRRRSASSATPSTTS